MKLTASSLESESESKILSRSHALGLRSSSRVRLPVTWVPGVVGGDVREPRSAGRYRWVTEQYIWWAMVVNFRQFTDKL